MRAERPRRVGRLVRFGPRGLFRCALAAVALVGLPGPGRAGGLPQEDPTRRPPVPALAGVEGEPDVAGLELEARRHEAALGRALVRRDALLARLEQIARGRSLADRILAPWRRRRARAELVGVVAELGRRQRLLLELRARREGQLARASEREWERLEALVAEAARGWRAGRSEDPRFRLAIAEALDRAALRESGSAVERYRSLVARLALVNAAIARRSLSASAVPPASQPQTAGTPSESGFLGLAERGADLDVASQGTLEAWERLRAGLVEEIVATASEVTR